MSIYSNNTDDKIIHDSIFRIGVVVSVEWQSVKVRVDKWKNTSSVLYKGDIIQNISVGGYIKIKKWFSEMIGKIEGENITEDKTFSKTEYKSNKEKISRILNIKILGYIENNEFKRWIKELPLIDNQCFLLWKNEFDQIHKFTQKGDQSIQIWRLEYDDGQLIEIWINSLFASHIGIFGNTWSGKSYTLAKIYKELFSKFSISANFRKNAKFFIIDFNWEYAWEETITKWKKVYNLTTRKKLDKISNDEKIPISETDLLDIELVSILSDATEKTQKPFISRAIRFYQRVINDSTPEDFFRNTLKNRIIEILKMSSKEKAFMLIEYLTLLLKDTDDWSLVANIEWNNKNSHFMIRGWACRELTDVEIEDTEIFKAASTYLFPSDVLSKLIHFLYLQIVYDVYNDKAQNEHIAPAINKLKSKREDIQKVLDTSWSAHIFPMWTNIVVLNLNDVNLDIRKTLPLLFAKKLYSEQKQSYITTSRDKSLHIIIDEAHNILSKESSREAESWKDYRLETFEEIIKEWRKFGTFLTVASQRPSDISSTIISQLHNYFLHRLINNNDLLAVEKTISYLDKVSADSIPNLATWTCIMAWLLAQIPVVLKVDPIPDIKQQPISQTINLLWKWI